MPNPKSQSVLFVTDKPRALARFNRASAGCSMGRAINASRLFLKPKHAAGRSVASIIAIVSCREDKGSSSGLSNCSLIWRRPQTPTWRRNWWSIRTSGTRWRLGRCAKRRQAPCSWSNSTSKFTECAGVSSASKCVRQSCAALNARRRPPVAPVGHCSLMKSSGTYGDRQASSSEVPVIGRRLFTSAQPTLMNSTCRSHAEKHFLSL